MSVTTHLHTRLGASLRWRTRARVVEVLGWLVFTSLLVTACGSGVARRAPTQRDIDRILSAMSDIVYQCESVATGYVAGADEASLRHDVDALVSASQQVRGNASFVVQAGDGQGERTTLSKQLTLAEENLGQADCSPGQARRIATSPGGR